MEKIVRELDEVIRDLKMDTANFDGCQRSSITLKKGEITGFIREETRLWREAWGLRPLKEIKKELKKFI